MSDLRSAVITSALALTLAVAALPAAAQSPSSGTTGATGTPGSNSTTGTLPDNSLAGQRQGAMSGGKAPQTGDQNVAPGSSGSSSTPTGTLPDNTLAGQRQGTIGGSVTQGGAGSTDSPQQPKQGSGQ